MAPPKRLGVGFLGSGFMTRFHLQSFVGVRDADVLGVFSPTREHREAAARTARELGLGDCRAFDSLEELVRSEAIDAIWIVSPNAQRVDNVQRIVREVAAGARLIGLCCEKPLARTSEEARTLLELVAGTGLLTGYLENQVFAPALVRGREILWRRGAALTGRPYLARAAEEHAGPHEPWFWKREEQGGGVLLDMLCHSVEAGRFLLTEPGAPRDSLRLASVSAQIAHLKWTRPEYRERLARAMPGVDYAKAPAEDFARATLTYRDERDHEILLEATTSWSYVGPGLRLAFELQGPEYSMHVDSLQSSCRLYLSRAVQGQAGEDLVEKQNSEQGLLPVLEDEAGWYGYVAENRHMVHAFLAGREPDETWRDGADVVDVLMACYRSARAGSVQVTLDVSAGPPPPGAEKPDRR